MTNKQKVESVFNACQDIRKLRKAFAEKLRKEEVKFHAECKDLAKKYNVNIDYIRIILNGEQTMAIREDVDKAKRI